jgi:hypothetical protein
MHEPASPARLFGGYTVGPFRLDPPERRLLRHGQPVPLPPKAFDLDDLSPDGTRPVFASSRSGQQEIWLADPDGSNAVGLPQHPAEER